MRRKPAEKNLARSEELLLPVLAAVARIAGQHRWFFEDHRKVRTRIDGVMVCPLQAVGYGKSKSGEVPDTRTLGASSGFSDRQGAAFVHLCDEIVPSPHYHPDLRRRLLLLCGLGPAEVPHDVPDCPADAGEPGGAG